MRPLPLETLSYFIDEKRTAIRWLDEPMRRHLCLLHTNMKATCAAACTRPYIQFFSASYTSHSLASRADLIGQPVRIYFDVEDVRLSRMFDVDGCELGVVEVQGAWRHTARTLRMCREILALVRERKLRIVRYDDPVAYLRKHAGKRRRSASKSGNGTPCRPGRIAGAAGTTRAGSTR
jgi:hypothetical protein